MFTKPNVRTCALLTKRTVFFFFFFEKWKVLTHRRFRDGRHDKLPWYKRTDMLPELNDNSPRSPNNNSGLAARSRGSLCVPNPPTSILIDTKRRSWCGVTSPSANTRRYGEVGHVNKPRWDADPVSFSRFQSRHWNSHWTCFSMHAERYLRLTEACVARGNKASSTRTSISPPATTRFNRNAHRRRRAAIITTRRERKIFRRSGTSDGNRWRRCACVFRNGLVRRPVLLTR